MSSILSPTRNVHAFIELYRIFRTRSRLIYELTRRELFARFSGQVLGAFWTIGHPFILILIYIFIFGFVFTIRTGGTLELPLNYTSYMLSGIIPWLVVSEVLGKSSTVIINNSNVVKQVIFPIEVLPVVTVMASLVTEFIFFFLLAVYSLIANHTIPWTYVLLPILVVFQVLALVGTSFLLSSIGVYFRDLKEFVQIFLSLGLFIIPVLYLPESIPGAIRPFLYLNPISYLVWCFQDILYFGRFAHPWAWLIFGVGSLSIFILGYRVFRKLQVMFGNVL